MIKSDTPENAALDALADRVLTAHSDFDSKLGRGRHFPMQEFDRLWRALLEYTTAMKGRKWLHRAVAREISNFREYLELEVHNTPSDVLRKADRMECLLFSDYDAYPDDGVPVEADEALELSAPSQQIKSDRNRRKGNQPK